MSLELVILIVGWAMVGVPVASVIAVSTYMVIGAAKDDEPVMALVMLGVTIFLIGAGILLLYYLTDVIPSLIG